ncbi:hypothetical protein EVAR_23532_1 [Eumeta japonica]|uniref:Uncharacterized protein n=1 Tax=Eumeta variegata TaxID=151549 RepID=A0A4C1W0J8_EUMVA|nr:hypothetical protein EVAR_23532_1 [Eumeta japonica]
MRKVRKLGLFKDISIYQLDCLLVTLMRVHLECESITRITCAGRRGCEGRFTSIQSLAPVLQAPRRWSGTTLDCAVALAGKIDGCFIARFI